MRLNALINPLHHPSTHVPGAGEQALAEETSLVPTRAEVDHCVWTLKGIAILGVVFLHLSSTHLAEDVRETLLGAGFFWQWATPTFMSVAGFLYGVSSSVRTEHWFGFVRRRANRLLIPFFVVSFAYAVAFGLLVEFGVLDARQEQFVWWERWLNTLSSSSGRLGEQLYFLPYLLMVSAVGVLVVKLKIPLAGAAATGLMLLVASRAMPEAFNQLPLHPPYRTWDMFASSLGLFLLGYVLQRRPLVSSFFCVAGSVGVAIAFIFENPWILRYFGALALSSLILGARLSQPALAWVGKRSGTIFLYHTPFLLQPPLQGIGTAFPASFQLPLALVTGVLVIMLLGVVHDWLIRSPFKRLTFA
ncbi:MAG: acyltransferase [Opitutaceae bacterium]|nr:acyltransferase [Opitutaceae bacterium]